MPTETSQGGFCCTMLTLNCFTMAELWYYPKTGASLFVGCRLAKPCLLPARARERDDQAAGVRRDGGGDRGAWRFNFNGEFNVNMGMRGGEGAAPPQPARDGLSDDAVLAQMRALPTELYEPLPELKKKSVKELRHMLGRRSVAIPKDLLEKQELLDLFVNTGSWTTVRHSDPTGFL